MKNIILSLLCFIWVLWALLALLVILTAYAYASNKDYKQQDTDSAQHRAEVRAERYRLELAEIKSHSFQEGYLSCQGEHMTNFRGIK